MKYCMKSNISELWGTRKVVTPFLSYYSGIYLKKFVSPYHEMHFLHTTVVHCYNDTLHSENTNLVKIPTEVHFWPFAYSERSCWHYLDIFLISKGIDIKHWVHDISKHVGLLSAYLTVKIIQPVFVYADYLWNHFP